MARSTVVDKLKECFARLPGIGPKTSERLTYHLLRSDPREALELAETIKAARETTRVCSICLTWMEVSWSPWAPRKRYEKLVYCRFRSTAVPALILGPPCCN